MLVACQTTANARHLKLNVRVHCGSQFQEHINMIPDLFQGQRVLDFGVLGGYRIALTKEAKSLTHDGTLVLMGELGCTGTVDASFITSER